MTEADRIPSTPEARRVGWEELARLETAANELRAIAGVLYTLAVENVLCDVSTADEERIEQCNGVAWVVSELSDKARALHGDLYARMETLKAAGIADEAGARP